jgi:hypothetical protein
MAVATPIPVTSVAGKNGDVTLVVGDITNLVSDLAAKAPLISPSLITPTIGVATGTSLVLGALKPLHLFDTTSSATAAQMLLQCQGSVSQTAALAFQVSSSGESSSYAPKAGIAYQRTAANGGGIMYFYNRVAGGTGGYTSSDIAMSLTQVGDGGVIAGNGPGLSVGLYTDTGFGVNADNLSFWESGRIAFNLTTAGTSFRIPSDFTYSWSAATNNNSASDTGFSRVSAGVIAFGNGTGGDASGTIKVGGLQVSGGTIVTKVLSATATLDFGNTSAQNSADLTITVTGAAVGDDVRLGIPAAPDENSCFTAWVSATNTVTVRFNNYSAGSINPASGTYRATVIHF